LEEAFLIGNSSANVGVILFVDYGCAACRAFEQHVMADFLETYVKAGRVQLAIWPLPLPTRGAAAIREANTVRCAGQSAKFLEAHTALLLRPSRNDDPAAVVSTATRISQDTLESCIASQSSTHEGGLRAAKVLGLRGTPAFAFGNVEGSEIRVTSVREGTDSDPSSFFTSIDSLIRAGGS
jgi:protein-disulfide isomerase